MKHREWYALIRRTKLSELIEMEKTCTNQQRLKHLKGRVKFLTDIKTRTDICEQCGRSPLIKEYMDLIQ